jgi:exodeoxyribonuclease VII small subunit
MTHPASDRPAAPSYEAARDELADVVRRLEQGGTTLEESLALWERGEQLAATCQEWLDGAKARLDAALGGSGDAGGEGGQLLE